MQAVFERKPDFQLRDVVIETVIRFRRRSMSSF